MTVNQVKIPSLGRRPYVPVGLRAKVLARMGNGP